jgi:hypothetical protein
VELYVHRVFNLILYCCVADASTTYQIYCIWIWIQATRVLCIILFLYPFHFKPPITLFISRLCFSKRPTMVAPLLFVVLLAAQYISASVLHQLETVPQTIASNVDKRQVLPKASWGHTVYLDAKASEWIYMSVIYSPGKPPANPKGSLFLWPGLFERENYQRSNLIQTVTELHSPAENRQVCGAKPGQW